MTRSHSTGGLPQRAGIGLKFAHIVEFLQRQPDIGFVEVHAENYLVAGGPRLAQLEAVRQNYPLSIHGVAASLGGDAALSSDHLIRLKRLVDRFEPAQFSEHLAWSSHADIYFNDLLPIPYTQARLERVVKHLDQLQSVLGRQVLLENPSSYVAYKESELSEADFMRLVVERSGCGLLLDVNNIVVSCVNQGLDAVEYLGTLPLAATGEIHLAGYAQEFDAQGQRLLIDSHASEVAPEVWSLYQKVLQSAGPQPTLLERDGALPSLDLLLAEAREAEPFMQAQGVRCAG